MIHSQQTMLPKISLGTTVIAVAYDGGVVLGADTRTTAGTYVANRCTEKLTQLSNQIYVARSGHAADTQMLSAYLQVLLGHHEAEHNEPPQVKTAACLAHRQVYKYKDALTCGLIVAGWDKHEGGSVFSIPMGGSMIRVPFAIAGSGGAFLYGWCDKNWRSGMDKNECLNFVTSAISLAISRDGSSGGMIRTVVVDSAGSKRKVISEDVPVSPGYPQVPATVH